MWSHTAPLVLAAIVCCTPELDTPEMMIPDEPEEVVARVCEAPATLADPLGDPALCSSYKAPELGPALEVGFINRRDEDIVLLGLGCADTYFLAFGLPGGRAAQWPYNCHAEPSPCEWLAEVEGGGCLANCPLLPPIRIAPGARFTTSWLPQLRIETVIPDDCTPNSEWTGACMALRRPTQGAYLMEARIVTPEACGSTCDCEPGAQGWCAGILDPPVQTQAIELVHAAYDGVCAAVDFVVEAQGPGAP